MAPYPQNSIVDGPDRAEVWHARDFTHASVPHYLNVTVEMNGRQTPMQLQLTMSGPEDGSGFTFILEGVVISIGDEEVRLTRTRYFDAFYDARSRHGWIKVFNSYDERVIERLRREVVPHLELTRDTTDLRYKGELVATFTELFEV